MALNSYYIWRQTETKKLKHTAWHDKGNTKRKKEKKNLIDYQNLASQQEAWQKWKKKRITREREREKGEGGKVQLFHQDKLGEKKKSKALNHSHIRKVMRKKNSSTINATRNRKSTSNLLPKGCQGKNCKKKILCFDFFPWIFAMFQALICADKIQAPSGNLIHRVAHWPSLWRSARLNIQRQQPEKERRRSRRNNSLSNGIIQKLVAPQIPLQPSDVQTEHIIQSINPRQLHTKPHFISSILWRISIRRLTYHHHCRGWQRRSCSWWS